MLVGAGRQFGAIIWRRKRPKKGHLTANNGSLPQQPTVSFKTLNLLLLRVVESCCLIAGYDF